MPIKNEPGNIEKVKAELLESYKKHLDEIFSPETFDFTFDEREKLIDAKMKGETCSLIEQHLKEDPDGIIKHKDNPDETCLCGCGLEAVLYRDKKGLPKIFEREIQIKNGFVNVEEYGYYCSKERKKNFPSKEET